MLRGREKVLSGYRVVIVVGLSGCRVTRDQDKFLGEVWVKIPIINYLPAVTLWQAGQIPAPPQSSFSARGNKAHLNC